MRTTTSSEPKVEVLCRYRSVNDDTINALSNNRLYFSIPRFFNDPFDSLLYYDDRKLIANIRHELDEGYDNDFRVTNSHDPSGLHFKIHLSLKDADPIRESFMKSVNTEAEKLRQSVINNSKVICFSEQMLSILMWSHYADYHKGFVIIYSVEDLEKASAYDENDNLLNTKLRLKKINYSKYLPDSGEYFYYYLPAYMTKKPANLIQDFGKRMLFNLMFNKLDIWKYEKEWRLCSLNTNFEETDPAAYIVIKPTAVLLGAKMNTDDKKRVLHAVARNHIPVFEVTTETNTRFHLSIKDVDTKAIRKAQ